MTLAKYHLELQSPRTQRGVRCQYYRCCVDWPEDDVDEDGGLCDMIQSGTDITRSTFLKHVNRDDLRDKETELGYEQHGASGLTMAGDWHVSYHRGVLHGKRVYFFKHSAIEYVFTDGGEP